MNTPVLETERLVLRKFMEDDLPELFDIYSDEDVNKYLPWFPLKSMEETKTFFEERYTPDYAKSEGYRYAICFKNDNVPIGMIFVPSVAGISHHGKEWTDDRHVDMGVEALYRTVLKVDEMNF